MTILITNDDGIDAPGLNALHTALTHVLGSSDRLLVVAPDRGRSECGHSVTVGRPLRATEIRPGWIAVDGTPVDCIRAALSAIAPETKMVFSGVNAGANLGVDLLVSGTFAAARESAIQGVPAMAVSHYRRPDVPNTWDHVPEWIDDLVNEFIRLADARSLESAIDRAPDSSRNLGMTDYTPAEISPAMLWNVNLPAIDPASSKPTAVRCSVDYSPMRREGRLDGDQVKMQTDFHQRPRVQGGDVQLCFDGQITVSELDPAAG